MNLETFNNLPADTKLIASIDILENVKNDFIQSLVLQWKRGYDLSRKQRIHLFLLAEQHLTSIERGYEGIDHPENESCIDSIIEDNLPYVEIKEGDKTFKPVVKKMYVMKPKPQKKSKVWRYKHKYRIADIQPLLDVFQIDCKRGVNPENDLQIGWIVGGDFYECLRDFVVWITDENPEHPLAGSVLDYPED